MGRAGCIDSSLESVLRRVVLLPVSVDLDEFLSIEQLSDPLSQLKLLLQLDDTVRGVTPLAHSHYLVAFTWCQLATMRAFID